VDALRSSPPGRLLEIGAGSGWFLRQVRDELPPWQCEALDYSEGAVRQLREAGFGASVGSAADLADDRASHGSFDAVCLFQTLEHMDSPHERVAAIRAVLAPKGRVFISVPNAAATDNQERLAGLPDTPPNHVGRWTVEALTRLFSAHGLKITQCELGPASRDAEIYRLAYWAMIADRWKGKKSPAFLVLRHASGRLRSLAEIRLVRRYSKRIGRACPNPPPADIWVEATVL
jgi:SAM-dependent methyltransferase